MAKKKEAEDLRPGGSVVEVPVEAPATDEPSADEPKVEAPVKASKTEIVIVIKYRDHRGEVVERTFSKEVHGADFAKLADEFKASNAKACEGLN